MTHRSPLAVALALGLLACEPTKEPTEGPGPAETAAPAETGETGEEAAETGEETAETAHTGEPSPWPVTVCDAPRAWEDGETGTGVKDLAGDFTLPTTRGDWTFSERWSGCESYLFVIASGSDYAEDLWGSDLDDLLTRAPSEIQVFFLSDRSREDDVAEDLAAIEASLTEASSAVEPAVAELWEGRFHLVNTPAGDLDGWVGEMAGQSWSATHFAIDRAQRLRSVGMLYNLSRTTPKFKYLANEPVYYAFEAEREATLEADGATVIPVWDNVEMGDPGWAGVSTSADVALPNAETMAGFDTLKLDLSMDCADHLDENCPAWDYLVNLYLCDEDDPESCSTEIGRFVTTYWREGRYVVDASHVLPMLQRGGTRRLRFYTTQTYLVSMDLRLSSSGSGLVASEAEYLFSGGTFDDHYNELFAPATITIPADARKVELVATISGHGWGGDTENCAEFCNHTHHFLVNGDAYVKEHPEAGEAEGCLEDVANGTVPNQFGTWYYGRGGWCPGREVTPWRQDITASVVIGAENEISYYGLLGDETYVPEYVEGGSFWANIQMTSWIVVWK